jgi:hypothetical protein
MNNRTYRLIFGTVLLIGLYFNLPGVIYTLIILLFIESVFNLTIPCIATRLRFHRECDPAEGSLAINFKQRFSFGAERAWRITVALMLILGFVSYYQTLWFVPWFMGFAIFGAGVSGVCPVFLIIKWVGFK